MQASQEVKRRKRCCKAVRFIRNIFTSPQAAAHSSALGPPALSCSTSTAERRPQCQHQQHCRFHRQGPKAWMIEVSMPCCGQAYQDAAAATAADSAPSQLQRTPTPTPPSQPRALLGEAASRQTLEQLQAAACTRGRTMKQKLEPHDPQHQSTPASSSDTTASAAGAPKSPELTGAPVDLSVGARRRISLRELSGMSGAAARTAPAAATTSVKHPRLTVVKVLCQQTAPAAKTLWLRTETASPLTLPQPAAILTSTVSATRPTTAASDRRASSSSAAAVWGPTLTTLRTSAQLAKPPQPPPPPPPPPPQLSKLRGPPVVVRAPQRSLTPSPERSVGGGGGGGRGRGTGGIGTETVTVLGSTRSSAAASAAASPPVVGRVAEAVRLFNSIRGGGVTLASSVAARPRCARSFSTVDVAAAASAPPAPTFAAVAPADDAKKPPGPSFRELLVKFEAFDRRRRERAVAAEAATAQEAASATTTATATTTTTTAPTPSLTPQQPPPCDSSVEVVSEAVDPPVVRLEGADDNCPDVGEGPISGDDAAASATGTAMTSTTRGSVGGGRLAFRTARVVLMSLVGAAVGHTVLSLVLAYGTDLSEMRSHWN